MQVQLPAGTSSYKDETESSDMGGSILKEVRIIMPVFRGFFLSCV